MGKILKGVGKLVGKITGSYDANKAAAAQADQMRQQNEREAKAMAQQQEQMKQQTLAQQSMADTAAQRDKVARDAEVARKAADEAAGTEEVVVDVGGGSQQSLTASRKRFQNRPANSGSGSGLQI